MTLRAASQPAIESEPAERVELSGGTQRAGGSATPLTAGLVGGVSGPVLAQELEALEADLALERRWRLPFMARYRRISPAKAAALLNQGRAERLTVDLGTGPLPLPSAAHFRELQRLEEQPGPPAVNPQTGLLAHPYEAFLNAPVVLMQDDLPAVLGQLATSEAVDPVLHRFPESEPLLVRSSRRMAEAKIAPQEIAERLRLLEGSPRLEDELKAVEAIEDPERFRAASHAFRRMLAEGATPREAQDVIARLDDPDLLNDAEALAARLGEDWKQAPDLFHAMQARGTPAWRAYGNLAPVAASLKDVKWGSHLNPVARLYDERLCAVEDPCIHRLLADLGTRGREAERLVERVLEPAGTLSLEERTEAYRQLVLGSKVYDQSSNREAAYEAFRAEVEAGATSYEAVDRLARLERALAEQKATYSSYVTPLLGAWARHLAGGPQTARDFVEELLAQGIRGREGARAVEQVTRPGEHLQAYRDLVFADPVINQDGVRAAAFEALLAEVEVGTPPAEAVARLQRLARALERNKSTYSGYAASAFVAYRENALGENETARDFLIELVDAGIRRREVVTAMRQVSRPLGGLSLEERIGAYRELLLSRKTQMHQDGVREAAFEAFRAELEHGTDPATARARLDRIAGALEAAKSTWSGYMAAAFQTYAQHLAGGADSDRAFTEELIGHGLRRGELKQAVAQGLSRPDGPELYRFLLTSRETPLDQDGVRSFAFEALTAELERGTPREVGRERLDRLAQGHTANRSTWSGYMASSLRAYARHLAGGEELESARAFLLRLDEAGVRRGGVERALDQVVEPLAALTLEERIGLYENTALAGGLERVRSQAFDIVRREVAAGAQPQHASARLRSLAEAFKRNRVSYHEDRVLDAYSRAFSAAPDAGVRVLVDLLDHGMPASRAGLATDLGPLVGGNLDAALAAAPPSWEQRLDFLRTSLSPP